MTIDLYERHAHAYDRERSRSLQERGWLDRFLHLMPPAGTILDVGCGMGEPIGRYLIERGRDVVGIDAAPAMIGLCRRRFPDSEWLLGDMRRMQLGRRFDGIVAWDSFFHLEPADQRGMFRRLASHARPGAALLFTTGPSAGESVGSFCGEPLYHASLAATEYARLLAASGFSVKAHIAEDPECGGHTVWLATLDSAGERMGGPP